MSIPCVPAHSASFSVSIFVFIRDPGIFTEGMGLGPDGIRPATYWPIPANTQLDFTGNYGREF